MYYRTITFFGRAFQPVHTRRQYATTVSTTPPRRAVWAVPFSLAATNGIEVSLFSSGYLDVSVPQVRLHALCIQAWISRQVGKGFPIRTSQDQSLVASSPGLIAGSNVLHRLLTPSHPPRALSSLITPTSGRCFKLLRNFIARFHNRQNSIYPLVKEPRSAGQTH